LASARLVTADRLVAIRHILGRPFRAWYVTSSMAKLFRIIGLTSCGLLLLGCPKKNGDGADAAADAPVEAEAPAAVVDAGPAPITARNSADVARFPGETAVTDDEAKLAQVTPVRTAPRAGGVVATLKPGAEVVKVAEYNSAILVTFTDPKDASATLMGWIGKEAFTVYVVRDAGAKDAAPVVDAGPPKLTCATGQVAVVLSTGAVCKKKCAKDADCKGGAAGACGNASSPAGGVVRACVAD